MRGNWGLSAVWEVAWTFTFFQLFELLPKLSQQHFLFLSPPPIPSQRNKQGSTFHLYFLIYFSLSLLISYHFHILRFVAVTFNLHLSCFVKMGMHPWETTFVKKENPIICYICTVSRNSSNMFVIHIIIIIMMACRWNFPIIRVWNWESRSWKGPTDPHLVSWSLVDLGCL